MVDIAPASVWHSMSVIYICPFSVWRPGVDDYGRPWGMGDYVSCCLDSIRHQYVHIFHIWETLLQFRRSDFSRQYLHPAMMNPSASIPQTYLMFLVPPSPTPIELRHV